MAGDWGLVGYGDDPIPDDPGVVAAQVDHIKGVAANVAAQVAALPTDGAIDGVPWQSDTGAPDQFKQVVKKLPADLDKLRIRYEKVGAAMATFQATLGNTKAQAQANLTKAVAAHHDIEVAQAGIAQMNDFAAQAQHQANTQNASAPPGTPPVHPHPWTGPDYHAQLAAAQGAFNAAKSAIDQAVHQFHDASRMAAAAVGAASHDDLKNDTSIWGSIVHGVESAAHWVSQHVPLQVISGVLKQIAAVAGILSFIPIIGEVALAVAVTAMAGALVCDAIIALNDAYQGTFGWNNVVTLGLDAVAVAVPFAGRGATVADAAAGEAAQAGSTAAGEAAQAGSTGAAQVARAETNVTDVTINAGKYPESAAHIQDARAAGQPEQLTIDRAGAAARRAESMRGNPRIPGLDRDEYPPAMFKEGGTGSSVRGINPSDNRGAGSSMGNQLRRLPDGSIIRIVIGS